LVKFVLLTPNPIGREKIHSQIEKRGIGLSIFFPWLSIPLGDYKYVERRKKGRRERVSEREREREREREMGK
jgi:hypothetical protein